MLLQRIDERKKMSPLLLVLSTMVLLSCSEAVPRYRVLRGMVGHAGRGYAVAGPQSRVLGLGFPTRRMGRIGGGGGGGMVDPYSDYDYDLMDPGPMATARIGSSMARAGSVAAGVSPDGVPWVSF